MLADSMGLFFCTFLIIISSCPAESFSNHGHTQFAEIVESVKNKTPAGRTLGANPKPFLLENAVHQLTKSATRGAGILHKKLLSKVTPRDI